MLTIKLFYLPIICKTDFVRCRCYCPKISDQLLLKNAFMTPKHNKFPNKIFKKYHLKFIYNNTEEIVNTIIVFIFWSFYDLQRYLKNNVCRFSRLEVGWYFLEVQYFYPVVNHYVYTQICFQLFCDCVMVVPPDQ